VADDIVPWLRQKAQWAEVDSDFALGLIDLCKEAADEIERLRAALTLAVGELSLETRYRFHSPDQIWDEFYEEARRG